MTKLLTGVALIGLLTPGLASATTYNFGMTFNGTALRLDGGSDVPVGTVLSPGDGFVLELSAKGNDFWRVIDPFTNEAFPLDFLVDPFGVRIANATSTFFLDGAQVEQIVETGVQQQFIHVGAQFWTLAQNLEFDAVELAYTMISGDTGTIQNTTNLGLFDSGLTQFFEDSQIEYVRAQAVVPLPASGLLYLAGLAGALLIGARARSRRKTAAV